MTRLHWSLPLLHPPPLCEVGRVGSGRAGPNKSSKTEAVKDEASAEGDVSDDKNEMIAWAQGDVIIIK